MNHHYFWDGNTLLSCDAGTFKFMTHFEIMMVLLDLAENDGA
jgi:hypothetical protein